MHYQDWVTHAVRLSIICLVHLFVYPSLGMLSTCLSVYSCLSGSQLLRMSVCLVVFNSVYSYIFFVFFLSVRMSEYSCSFCCMSVCLSVSPPFVCPLVWAYISLSVYNILNIQIKLTNWIPGSGALLCEINWYGDKSDSAAATDNDDNNNNNYYNNNNNFNDNVVRVTTYVNLVGG